MKTISFVFTGPPAATIGSFVGVIDSEGNEVNVGWWEHDGEHWRYVCPVELVPRLVGASSLPDADAGQPPSQSQAAPAIARPAAPQIPDAIRQRQALKEKVKNLKKKEPTVPTQTEPVAIPAHWEKCPSCQKAFDPGKDELLDCSQCGESKCTAECMKDPVKACVDCQALVATADDGGFDPSATPPSVFDKGFSATTVATAAAKGLVPSDDDVDGED